MTKPEVCPSEKTDVHVQCIIITVKSLAQTLYLRFLFLFTSNLDAFTLPYPSVFSSPQVLLNNKEFISQNKYVCMYQLCGNLFSGLD